MSRAVAADVKAGRDRTVIITKASKRSFFSRVSEATLGTFPGHFWSVLGTKLGGVSAFRVVAMSRAVAADVKATGRDRTRQDGYYHKGTVITKAGKRSFFSRVSEATLGTFPGHFWSVLGTKLGGASAFRVVAMSRAVAADVKATGRDRTVITKGRLSQRDGYHTGRQRQKIFFSRVSEATLGTFPGHFWSVLGTKLGGCFSVSSGGHESSCCS